MIRKVPFNWNFSIEKRRLVPPDTLGFSIRRYATFICVFVYDTGWVVAKPRLCSANKEAPRKDGMSVCVFKNSIYIHFASSALTMGSCPSTLLSFL